MKKQTLPQLYRFVIPIIEVLKEVGGEGKANKVTELVINKCNISEKELEKKISSGYSRIKNQIGWARTVVGKLDYVASPQPGVWRLTEKGKKAELTQEDLHEIYRTRKQWWNKHWQISPAEQARLWKDFLNNSIAAVEYSKLDFDLAGKSEEKVLELFKKNYPEYPKKKTQNEFRKLWQFLSLKPNDKLITNKGRSLLLGLSPRKISFFKVHRELAKPL